MRPLAIDLYCGLGGWAEGLLAEGYDVIGFDIEQHIYGDHRYPAMLAIQDVLTLHGSQFKDATLIVASPPCQEYSYMAMPWSLAKAKAAAIRADTSGKMLADLNRLFDACFRIQAQASLAAGRRVPMIVENVRGAQEWVGRARWAFGSYFLWGDVPALMPIAGVLTKQNRERLQKDGHNIILPQVVMREGFKSRGLDWNDRSKPCDFTRHAGAQAIERGVKNGNDWFGAGMNASLQRRHGSRSTGRKFASAVIAKIPLPLSQHIAATLRRSAT
jgi:hypothetical protein